jgi:hypothetical protein
MVVTFKMLNFGTGIWLGSRAWNFRLQPELCGSGVRLRLNIGVQALPGKTGAVIEYRAHALHSLRSGRFLP